MFLLEASLFKARSFTFLLIILFSSFTLAEIRSTSQRLSGFGHLDKQTDVNFPREIIDFEGNPRSLVKLTTPHTSFTDSLLNLEKTRSLVRISSKDLSELDSGTKGSSQKDAILSAIRKLKSKKASRKKAKFSDFWVLGNFVHTLTEDSQPSFFIVVIPIDIKVEKLIFQTEWFGNGLGGHAQLRMVLSESIYAIPQSADQYSAIEVANSDGKADLIYSLQAARRGDKSEWSVFEGLMGEYGNALQLFSTRAKAKNQIFDSVVTQHEIVGLKTIPKKKVFLQALKNSTKLSETTIYNTVFNSCITHAVLTLKPAFKNLDTLIFNPYTMLKNLNDAGAKFNQLPNLNTEFANYARYAKDGQSIKTEAQRRSEKGYIQLQPFENNLLQSDEFEEFIRKLAIFIIDEKIQYSEVASFLEGLDSVLSNEKKVDKALGEAGKLIYDQISNFVSQSADIRAIVQQHPELLKLAEAEGIKAPNKQLIYLVKIALTGLKTQE